MGLEDYLENFANHQGVIKQEGKAGKNDDLSVKEMIEELYWKEKKYVRQYLWDDFIGSNDFIFDLNKTHHLKLAKSETASTAMTDVLSIQARHV